MNVKSSSQPIPVAIDTCLIIGLFFDEDPELSEITEQLFLR
ncbi:MAG: hypothetical protein Q4A31_09135 [Corynebacterium sp.]|nr:hypothetical protein [Corynebacterium sp.]MDO4762067.1 hypothetical protein [Corynebacterium sp.]